MDDIGYLYQAPVEQMMLQVNQRNRAEKTVNKRMINQSYNQVSIGEGDTVLREVSRVCIGLYS